MEKWMVITVMYKVYWGMTMNPFSKEIKETDAFHSLDYLEGKKRYEYLRNVRGIGLFTGLSGTGKTFCQRCFAKELNPSLYKVVYIPMTTVTSSDFYKAIAIELGLEPSYRKIDNFRNIQDRIRKLYKDQKVVTVILVDEAQYLGKAVLADLKLLMNFDMDCRDYAILVLSGQPVLNSILSMQVHEALAQRIVISYEFQGLTSEEVTAYIKDRMKMAGVMQEIFQPQALEAAYGCCQGSVRKLNRLIHRALMIGCEQKSSVITSEIMMAASTEIELL